MKFFSKLPKEKRTHFILVVVITIAVLGGLGFGLIKSQFENLRKIADKQAALETKLQEVENSIKNADKLEAQLGETKTILSAIESNMAPGGDGAYLWIINAIRAFRSDYSKVEIPQFGPSATIEEMNLFPKFPYKQAALTVVGKAHYHDLGVFLADLENKFPHVRILNLDLKLSPESGPGEREKISFTMEFVTLVKPTP